MRLSGLFDQMAGSLQRVIESLPGMAKPADRDPDDTSPSPDKDAAAPQDSDKPEPAEYRASGVFTAVALYVILLVVAFRLDGYSALWRATAGTFFGSLTEGRVIDHSLIGLLGTLASVVTVVTPLALAAGALGNLLYGQAKSHTGSKLFSRIRNHYFLMTATVTVEELVARMLFLGVPLLFGHEHLSRVWFWVLFLAGNSLWAVFHLTNYRDKKEWHVLRTLPQFVGGVFNTVVFINFGFFGVLVVHLAYNNLLFSTMRKGVFNRGEIQALLLHGMVVVISGCFLVFERGKSLFDMTYWLNSSAADYRIPGWTTSDYLWGVLMATSLLFVIGDLLLFDLYRSDDQEKVYDNLLKAVSIIGFAFGAFFVLRELSVPFEMRVAVMALIFMIISRTASGSGLARVFWIGIPWLMILLCTTLALGVASPVWFIMLAVALVEAVDDVIRIRDRRAEEKLIGGALALLVPSRSK